MGRQIKFRAWDGKKMIYDSDVQTSDFCLVVTMEGELRDNANGRYEDSLLDFPLMQFTGLRDKNGVEIYEGDIVRATAPAAHKENNCISDIIEDTKDTAWAVRSLSGDDRPYHFGLNIYWWAELEVIGNIHEDPPLTERNKDK